MEEMENKDLILQANDSLKKVLFLLSEWVNGYSFNKDPDPEAAIEYINSYKEEDRTEHRKQSFNWFYDYQRIHTLIIMALDYTNNAMNVLKPLE